MDDDATFLELPLERDLYKPKIPAASKKKPLRVLITEAATKIAYQLIYKICSGEVFGPDQDIILHLISAKGTLPHKSILYELEECGFHVCIDSVVSGDPKKAYKKVNLVILIALFEKISGWSTFRAFLYQMTKIRQVVVNMMTYADPNVKLVMCGTSTKGVAVMLTIIAKLKMGLKNNHISGVTLLDEAIAKSAIAAHLRTTTDTIKNVLIWGATYPDIRNATVYMYPPNDNGRFEKKEVPLVQALQDDKFIREYLMKSIFRRVMPPALLNYGKAVALATAKHLRLLFVGTHIQTEYASMASIVPPSRPYHMQEDIGLSFPVTAKDGSLQVLEGLSCEPYTHIMNIKLGYMFHHDTGVLCLNKVVDFLQRVDTSTGKSFTLTEQEQLLLDKNYKGWLWDYIITPTPHEFVPEVYKSASSTRKSITWNETKVTERSGKTKSSLRFNPNVIKHLD